MAAGAAAEFGSLEGVAAEYGTANLAATAAELGMPDGGGSPSPKRMGS